MKFILLPIFLSNLFFFLMLFDAQAQWPDASIYHQNPWQGGIALTDGSFIGIDASSGTSLYISKIFPNGNLRYLNTLQSKLTYVRTAYDSVNQRIFICDYWSGNQECVAASPWDSATVNSNYIRLFFRMNIICIDTAGVVLWAKHLTSPVDSLSSVGQVLPDGNGGIYVSSHTTGNIRQAINSNQWTRVGPGFYQLVHFDKNGTLRWTRRQYSPPKSSIKRAIGTAFLIAKPARGIDWITLHADTNISQYCNQPVCAPNAFELSAYSMDSSGELQNSRTGSFSGDFIPARSGLYFELLPHRIDGKLHYFLMMEAAIGNTFQQSGSGVLKFDSTLQLLQAWHLPIYGQIVGGLASFSNNRIGARGITFDPTSGTTLRNENFVFLDSKQFFPLAWHQSRNTCVSRTSFMSPSIFNLPRFENGARKEDLMGLFFTGDHAKASVVHLRFEDGIKTPCRGTKSIFPFPQISTITNQVSLVWQNGALPISFSTTTHWQDTLIANTYNPEPMFSLVDICDTLDIGLTNRVSCQDSIAVALPFEFQYDEVRVNGAPISNPLLNIHVFRSSGLYTVTLWDTCRLTPFRMDTIRITLLQSNQVILSKDTLRFCPGQQGTVSVSPASGYYYVWGPESWIKNPAESIQQFYADSIPKGTYLLAVSGALSGGECPSADTLVIQNFSQPYVPIQTSNPDSLLWIDNAGLKDLNWSVNGGIFIGSTTQSMVRLNWAPYFEGQNASITYVSLEGCPGKTTYLRLPPDTLPVILPDTSWSPFEFPNLITKNGDDRNENFEIKNLQSGDLIEISFYNRWGEQVYSAAGYSIDFPKNRVVEGNYYWIANITYIRNGKVFKKLFKDWVLVIKD